MEASDARRGAWEGLDERLGLSGIRYPVARHANSLPYTLGGITLAVGIGAIVLAALGLLATRSRGLGG